MFQMISTGDNKRPAAAFLPRDFHADPGMAFSHILANCAFVTSPGTGGARSLLGGGGERERATTLSSQTTGQRAGSVHLVEKLCSLLARTRTVVFL